MFHLLLRISEDGKNSGGKKEKNLALCLFIAPICAAEDSVPAYTQETAQNHGQMGKFPTKGSEGTWKWIFFADQEAQTDNIHFAEKSFCSFEPCFAAKMLKFMKSLE